jgi:hypothetical protein
LTLFSKQACTTLRVPMTVAWYTQRGHKLRFLKGGKAQFVTVGIIELFKTPPRRRQCRAVKDDFLTLECGGQFIFFL